MRVTFRVIYSIALSISLLIFSLTFGGTAYAAETGGYPWADAAEVNASNFDWGYMACQPAMQTAQTCSAHYGYKSGFTYHLSDPWHYDVRNCTSFVAWRVSESFGIKIVKWGDAKNWDATANRAGYKVNSEPAIGDIAVWDSGKFGHVAFVTTVNPDSSVNVEQYNKAGKGEFSRQSRVRADNYIHVAPEVIVPPAISIPVVTDSVVQTIAQSLPAVQIPKEITPIVAVPTPIVEPPVVESAPSKVDDTSYFAGSEADQKPRLYAIKTNNTKSGKVEVSVSDSQSSDAGWLQEKVTPELAVTAGDVSYTLGDYNADGTQDLYRIAYDKTASGKVEVSILDGATNYLTYLGKWTTAESQHLAHDVWYGVADQNGDGALDLYQVWHNHTFSEHVEVKVFSGTAFSTELNTYMVPEPQHEARDAYYMIGDHNSDGKIDLFQILHNKTASGKAEIQVFDGLNELRVPISKWVTEQAKYSGYGPSL